MKARIRVWFLWSWVITLPVTLLGGYWLYSTLDRFGTYNVRYQAVGSGVKNMALGAIGQYESEAMAHRVRAMLTQMTHPPSALNAIHLFVPEAHLARLQSHMPQSGFRYVKGRMLIDGKLKKMKFRYRGDSYYRWAWDKKSIRIKTSKKALLNGVRVANLLAARTDEQLNNYLSYKLAELIGLLSPRSELTRVFINGEDRGVYFFVEQINEMTLRHHGRMPGDIYRGEIIAKDRYRDSGISNLFNSVSVWDKVAVNNHYPEQSVLPLERLLALLAQPGFSASGGNMTELLDIEAWARYSVYEALTQSTHADNVHNWRIYYDPWRGKLVPMVWDPMGWRDTMRGKKFQSEIRASLLMEKLFVHDEFLRIRGRILREFFESGKDGEFMNFVKRKIDVMKQEVLTDPLLKPASPAQVSEAMQRLQTHIEFVFKHFKAEALSQKHSMRGAKSDSVVKRHGEKPVITWSGDVIIRGEQIINDLVIKPGTDVRMAAGASIIIRGQLQANGTELKPIRFLPLDSSSKPWGTIAIVGPSANGSSLRHCEFSGGSGFKGELLEYSAMLSIHDVQAVTIADCLFRDNHSVDDMVHAVYSDIRFDRVQFKNAVADALDLDISKAVVTNSRFENSNNDALDLMTTEAVVVRSVFSGSGDKGISVGESSDLFGVNNILIDNQIGVQSKDASTAILFNQSFKNNGTALHAYKKNWQYGTGGTIFLAKSIVSGGKIAARAQKQSTIQLFDSFVEGRLGNKRITLIDTDTNQKRNAKSDKYLPENSLALPKIYAAVDRLTKEHAGVWQQVSSNLRGARQFE
jgi:hypothetical protein